MPQTLMERGAEQQASVAAYKASRDETWNKVFAALRRYRMTNMTDDLGGGYPLVDLMTPDDETIAAGEMEMVSLADEIVIALSI